MCLPKQSTFEALITGRERWNNSSQTPPPPPQSLLWLSSYPTTFSPELSLEENFFGRAVKISEHTYHYLHSQCAYGSELIGVVMTSESKLGVSS